MLTKVILVILSISYVFSTRISFGQTVGKASFSFTLSENVRSSAGIFNKDGTLIRTLWNGVAYAPGNYTQTWDGLDDQGKSVVSSNYEARLLTNNISYTWEGVIGNTSDRFTGTTVHHDFDLISGMAVTNNTVYYCSNYNEAQPAQGKFNSNNPQAKTKLMKGVRYGQQTQYVASDGNRVYWAGFDPYSVNQNYSFVFATQTSNETEVIFPRGHTYTTAWGGKYKSAISIVNKLGSTITGLAVQKTGEYIFVARKALDQIQVINKSTGEIIQTLTLTAPRQLTLADDKHLWLITGATVASYSIANSGELIASGIRLSGLTDPLALGISPDKTTLIVVDGGSSQQLKAFNPSKGDALWIHGQLEGYATDASVSDDKFYFSDSRGSKLTFLAFQTDGSFWVGDGGNYRCQHFSGDRRFIETLMYLPHNRSMALDLNDAKRVFADYLEFDIDYSKPLGATNNSWKFVKNWGHKVASSKDDEFSRLITPVTLLNGRTYALQPNGIKNQFEVVELVQGKVIRFTAIILSNNYRLYADGSLRRISDFKLGVSSIWYKRTITGFDSINNPIWSPEAAIATSPPSTSEDPLYRKTVAWGLNPAPNTNSDLIISYEGGSGAGGLAVPFWASSRYHLGAVRLGEAKWLWRTASNTPPGYQGPYPTDGSYDLGNGVEYPGGPLLVQDKHIFWNYHGEFWKQSQTNKWQHVFDNGLLLGVFGVTGPEVANQEAPWGMAGNTLRAGLTKIGEDYYIYHCDESIHGGVHRWKVSGLSSIRELHIPLTTNEYKQDDYVISSDMSSRQLSGLNIYPNPTENVLQVTYPLTTASEYLEIVSLKGETMKKWEIMNGTEIIMIDTSFLPKGVFILRYGNGSSLYTKSFLKL